MSYRFSKNLVNKFRKLRRIMTKAQNKPTPRSDDSHNATSVSSPNLTFLPKLNTSDIKFEVLPTPLKSESDKKEYKVIRLENGLIACLISDKAPLTESDDEETDEEAEAGSEDESYESSMDTDDEEEAPEQKMAAAALCINVGSFSDPKSIPGMAHFLEHMVFMGSEKFPEENDFDAFLSKRGGSDNASTDCEHTTFYFECLEKHFYTALDKWAQFFISPLMKRGSMTREREAIESEFQMALPLDSHKKDQLLASLSKIDSPVNAFTWGNLITLRDNVSDDVLYETVHQFRKRHYSAHRMTLAIQARLPMDVLESFVLDCFSSVPCNKLPPDNFKQFTKVFDTPEFSRLYYVQPTDNVTQVELTFAMPSLLHKYRSKSHHYVSYLLGDEGQGSLLSYLRKKVWVLTLSSGNGESGSEHNSLYALFSIGMTLTEEGLAHLYEVIEAVFSYINMLKEVGPQERVFNEIKLIADNAFRFASEERAVDVVEELSENMHLFRPEDYLTGSELYFEYDPETINLVMDSLNPRKMNIILLCNNLPQGIRHDKVEKWFGTRYTDRQIPEEWLSRWEKTKPLAEFKIPPPNQYLTTDFKIVEEDEEHPEYPEKVHACNLEELWYRKDQKFKLPTAFYYFYMINPDAVGTARNVSMLDFFMHLLQLQMIEDLYPAQVAGYTYCLKTNDKGLMINILGYSEKLDLVIDLIANHLQNFNSNLTEDTFEAVKDKLVKYYFNSLIKPSSLAKDVRLHILVDKAPAIVDKYNGLFSVTFEEMKKFAAAFINHLYIKALVQGNVSKETAMDTVDKFVSSFGCRAIAEKSYPIFRVMEMPKGETVCRVKAFNKNDSNSIIKNYYQAGTFSIRDAVIIEIIVLTIQEPLFDTLRTKEQLGYHVYTEMRETYGILGFTITVNAQATKHTTEYVDNRIEEFVKDASKLIDQMSDKQFQETKKDMIKMKQCADVYLREEVDRNWEQITEDEYMFDRLKQEIKAVEALKMSDVQKWWKKHGSGGSQDTFKKLSVQIVGFDTNDETEQAMHSCETSPCLAFTKKNLNFLVDNMDKSDSSTVFIKDIGEFKKRLNMYPAFHKPPGNRT